MYRSIQALSLVLCLFAVNVSFEQRLPLRSGQRSSRQLVLGVKGRGVPRKSQRASATSNSFNDTDECKGVTVKQVDDEVAAAHNALELHGDKSHDLSYHEDDQVYHCKDAKKNLKKFSKHLKCIPGPHGEALRVIGKGFTKAVNRRCTSKKWHDDYVKFSHCISDPDIYEEFHYCKFRFGASQEYILREIPEEDQAFVLTCDVVPRLEECMKSYVGKHCGRKAADFIVDSIWEPYIDYMKHSVGGDFNKLCYSKYPDAVPEFDKIYSTKPRELKMGWWKIFFKIADNSYKE